MEHEEAVTAQIGRTERDRPQVAMTTAAAVVVLGAVVALASREPLSGSRGSTRGLEGLPMWPLMLLGAAGVVATIASIAWSAPRRRPIPHELARAESSPMRWSTRLGLVVLPAALIGLLIAAAIGGGHIVERGPSRSGPTRPSGGQASHGRVRAGPVQRYEVPGWLLVAAGVTAAATGVLVLGRRLGAGAERRHDEQAPASVESVIDASLERLASDPDPRRAVIAAYAGMERALAGRGLGREAYEGPREYVTRALDRRGADPAALRRLGALYEEARFSRHPIGERMRSDALSALRAVRDGGGPR